VRQHLTRPQTAGVTNARGPQRCSFVKCHEGTAYGRVWTPTFRRNILPPSSGLKHEQRSSNVCSTDAHRRTSASGSLFSNITRKSLFEFKSIIAAAYNRFQASSCICKKRNVEVGSGPMKTDLQAVCAKMPLYSADMPRNGTQTHNMLPRGESPFYCHGNSCAPIGHRWSYVTPPPRKLQNVF
jgi:hypothetical protein